MRARWPTPWPPWQAARAAPGPRFTSGSTLKGASRFPTARQLLDQARIPTWRIWAENAPFDLKEKLKARGYRWNADGIAGPRAWYVDVLEADRAAEVAFLQAEIYGGEVELLSRRITAYDRFSERC